MKYILINLISKSLEEGDFEYYTKLLPSSFEVYNYYFSRDEMFPDIVEAIIKQIQQEKDLDILNTKIVLQTNVADIGHFSAKFYSELLDGVIIIPKKIEVISKLNEDYSFMNEIIQQHKFDKYRLSKVYINNLEEEYLDYLLFLNENSLFNEIEPIEKFKFVESNKLNVEYQYFITQGSIKTNFFSSDENIIQINCVDKKETNLINNKYGLICFLKLVMEFKTISLEIKRSLIVEIRNQAINLSCENDILSIILEHLNSEEVSFRDFVDYNYTCMVLGDRNGLIRQYRYLIEHLGNLALENVYALITNSMFYISRLNQISNAFVVESRLMLMDCINKYWNKEIEKLIPIKRNENHIAIVTGQLLSINHAPTRFTIDYANSIKKYNPKIKIKIFVEDWARYCDGELVGGDTYSSAKSSVCKKEHDNYLHPEIKVHYSNSDLNRIARTKEDINSVCSFKPSVILKMGSKYNIVTDLLYPFYPIVSCTMGGAEDCNYVDLFTGGYTVGAMYEMYKESGLLHQEYRKHVVGIETPAKIEKKSRKKYDILESDSVMVTVGNRLEAEFTNDFVEKMIEILDSNINFKWVIVGTEKIDLLNNTYKQYIENKQIKFISYEPQLFDFYHLCDIYVNPIRKTGGHSGAMAMKAKLPVITTDHLSDIGLYVGVKNCLSLEEYFGEITNLIENPEYYKEKSEEMFERIETEFSFKRTVQDLEGIFKHAIEKFEKRKQDSQ